jgi:hypothetical protein
MDTTALGAYSAGRFAPTQKPPIRGEIERNGMRKRKAGNARFDTNSATVGYEAQLWRMADALRGSMDAAEYKHVVKPFNICYGET